jgi:L-histidine Nalpha-methyltransferase
VSGSRVQLLRAGEAAERDAMAKDVLAGLSQSPRRLSCRYFYDAEGSALFEEICGLQEYYLTRAEREILERRAEEIAQAVPAGAALVELGSGSSAKTSLLIEALLRRQGALRYLPIDVSAEFLEQSAHRLADRYPGLSVLAIAAEYQSGLARVAQEPGAKLVLWLGSSVGNLDREAAATFLRQVRGTMAPADRLLLGVDLRKDKAVLERAYDDAKGVTARFNLNLLHRLNAELGADFAVERFGHLARYDEALGRIEMYLESRAEQEVHIRALGRSFRFAAKERIHTENSYKYSLAEVDALADRVGFTVASRWLDAQGRFSLSLLAPLP